MHGVSARQGVCAGVRAKEMIARCATICRQTTEDTDVLDITEDVREVVRATGAANGLVSVSVAGSTASITTIEFEPGAIEDLKAAIARIAPTVLHYHHDARWGDGNGYSHVRAALLGPSICMPLCNTTVMLGKWQQIVLCDFDNRSRTREVLISVLGQ